MCRSESVRGRACKATSDDEICSRPRRPAADDEGVADRGRVRSRGVEETGSLAGKGNRQSVSMQQREVRDIKIVNKPLVVRLARELCLAVNAGAMSEYELKADLKVASFARKTTRPDKTSVDSPEVLNKITSALRDSGQLRVFRPESAYDFRWGPDTGWYVKETMAATPVLVPVPDDLITFGAPEKLKVWVSDPLDIDEEVDSVDSFAGSFVFLVEELVDAPIFDGYISGISALRLLVEGFLKDRDITVIGRRRDNWGRDSNEHPIEKLQRAGGIPLRERIIETVYRIVYMTDEQAWTHNGVETRVHDILGYPLYIAE